MGLKSYISTNLRRSRSIKPWELLKLQKWWTKEVKFASIHIVLLAKTIMIAQQSTITTLLSCDETLVLWFFVESLASISLILLHQERLKFRALLPRPLFYSNCLHRPSKACLLNLTISNSSTQLLYPSCLLSFSVSILFVWMQPDWTSVRFFSSPAIIFSLLKVQLIWNWSLSHKKMAWILSSKI